MIRLKRVLMIGRMHLEGVMLSTSVERARGKTCNVSRWGGSGFETQQSISKMQWRWQRQHSAAAAVAAQRRQQR